MVQFVAKRRLAFTNGEETFICSPHIIETAPEWVKGTPMWRLALMESGLITVFGEAKPVKEDKADEPAKAVKKDKPKPEKAVKKDKE